MLLLIRQSLEPTLAFLKLFVVISSIVFTPKVAQMDARFTFFLSGFQECFDLRLLYGPDQK